MNSGREDAWNAGWNDNWLGLEYRNPYPVNSPNYQAYNDGWDTSVKDAASVDDFCSRDYPSNEYAYE